MKWSNEPPTESGIYWMRVWVCGEGMQRVEMDPDLIAVSKTVDHLGRSFWKVLRFGGGNGAVSFSHNISSYFHGEFALYGPIAPPEFVDG